MNLSTPLRALACLSVLAVLSASATAGDDVAGARQKAVQFLKTTQADDGSWTVPNNAGITGLAAFALLRSGVPADDPAVARSLKHLQTFARDDGGIYDPQSDHKNYETSIALLAFAAANKDGKYDTLIAGARDFLKGLQWDDADGSPRPDPRFGGAGYGRSKRPDLSNTAFFVEALKAAGVGEDDEAMKNALVFVSRCQNLETEHNNTEFAAKLNDGGFYYTPAAEGTSQAGKAENGGLRSYGSMTYAGLKSMIHAGLTPDDPRVKAAVEWLRKHYSVEDNPGMGKQGLYYYYHTFAKSLAVLGQDQFEDAQGVKHDWRKELSSHLVSLQKENGSWVNAEPRWMEGDPNMATAYSLLALAYCEE